MNRLKLVVVLVAGISLGAVGALLAARLQAQSAQAPPRGVSQTLGGRYQIVMHPQYRADTFLLDTETGRVWQPTVFPFLEGDPDAWVLQARISTDDERTAFISRFNRKEAK